jgi:hypothetical protein
MSGVGYTCHKASLVKALRKRRANHNTHFAILRCIVRGESQKRCLLFCEALGPSSFLLPKHPRIAICEINIVVQQQSLVSFGLAQ